MAKKLLIIGGGTVMFSEQEIPCTKGPISDYLAELATQFDACTWVANRDYKNHYSAEITTKNISVIAVEPGWCGRLRSWLEMIPLALQHEYLIYFLPNHFLPILPLLRWRSKRMAVYLAGDYEINIESYAAQRWLGWATLMRLSFELPMKWTDVVIARGRKLASQALRFNKYVKETVPMGHMANPTATQYRTSQKEANCPLHLLFIGKILEGKGVGILINAFEKLLRSHPEKAMVLKFVGDGDEKSHFETQVNQRNLSHCIEFIGWVSSGTEMNTIFAEADVLIVPSELSYPEGVPRVIDEAILRETPVVATASGGIPEEFLDGEIALVMQSEPQAIADAIGNILFDTTYRNQLLGRASSRRKLFLENHSAARQHAMLLLEKQDGISQGIEKN